MLSNKQRLHLARLTHIKWLKSIGIKKSLEDLMTYKKVKVKSKGDLDLSHLKVKDSMPTSDRIVGNTYKRFYSTELPAGKTISVAYNKGAYQVVDAKDFKTMGRKI